MIKEISIGFLVGLLSTLFGSYIFVEYFSNYGFYTSLNLIEEGGLYGKIISIGAIANFFPFFIFLKKKQIYRARGVLMESILVAFVVLILTFFINQ